VACVLQTDFCCIPSGLHTIITKTGNIGWTPCGICGVHLESMGEGKVHSHPMVDEMIDKTAIKNILVYIQDTEPVVLKHLLDLKTPSLFSLVPTNQCMV
jgi:hypothetical protein